jgi:hypothetical protein
MIKKNHSTGRNSFSQRRGSSKLFNANLFLVLLLAVFAAGCQKDGSTATAPAPALTQAQEIQAAETAISPSPINLGTADDFTILTETGISTTGVTSITGNIGVSPIAATAITGFGLIMATNNQSSHTPIVIGDVYAPNYAPPTPSKMTTAVSNMKTAFTAANGLTYPAPVVEKYAGNISGKTLLPGLYKWSTGLLVTDVGTTLAGGPNSVWVFQIAQNLNVNNGAIIHLVGGAQAKNVFWVVSGKVTIGTTVNFSGIVLSKTLIAVNTGAKVTGRLFAQTAVTLIANDVKP